MSATVSLGSVDGKQPVRWVPIQLPEGEFEIGIRPPTFEELCADSDGVRPNYSSRIERFVTDWRGISCPATDMTDPQNPVQTTTPIPFSVGDLKRLCTQYPAVFTQVMNAVNRVYRGLDEGQAKN